MTRLIFVLLVIALAINSTPVVINNSNVIVCEICKMAVKLIIPEADKDLDQLEKEFIQGCMTLIGWLPYAEKECKALAKIEINAIKTLLENGSAPEEICTTLHAC
ncbi:surfactant protein B [Ancylostoma duodenale]|uniref:Surfactant protein B n=1 Tax=Ancylostoma duodenale TaxID=51022 RepID=A0A0C2H7N4_9BILA|nr:surfactant protein B [Ancylostoma duodenale]